MAKKDPKQPALPGMKNRKLQDLHEAAFEYDKAKKERMEKTKPETDAKATLMRLMHKHKKTVYKCEGVTILLTVEKEKIKVTVDGTSGSDEEETEETTEEA